MGCTSCKASPRARATLNEANFVAPNRKRASDGICASAAHHAQNPTSGHEPWPPKCEARADDTTHDPPSGMNMHVAAATLQIGGWWHPALRYWIFNRRICFFDARNGFGAKTPQPYHGSSGHLVHMHTEWQSWMTEDTSPFWYYALRLDSLPPQPPPQPQPIVEDEMGIGIKDRVIQPGTKRKLGWVTQNGLVHNGHKYEAYVLIFADEDTPASGRLDIDGTVVGNWSVAGDTPVIVQPDRSGAVEVTVDAGGGPVLVEVREI